MAAQKAAVKYSSDKMDNLTVKTDNYNTEMKAEDVDSDSATGSVYETGWVSEDGTFKTENVRKAPKRQRPGSDSLMEACGLDTAQMIKDIQGTIQTSLRDSMQSMVQEVVREVTHNIEQNIEKTVLKKLSDDIFMDLGQRISQMEHSMQDMKGQMETLQASIAQGDIIPNQHIQAELNSLKQTVTSLTQEQNTEGFSNEANIVIKGMSPCENLEQAVTDLAQALEVNVNIRKVNKVPGPSGVIIATLASRTQRDQLIQKKYSLRQHEQYQAVYIETDRPKEERRMEANMRKIVNQLPNLQFKKGRIVQNDAEKKD